MKIAPPIFVTGCARSGTTLFTRLLDGHPDVLVFPIELKYFRHLDTPTFYPKSKLASCATPREAVAAVVESPYMRPLYGDSEEIGGRSRVLEVIAEKVDAARFRDALRSHAGVVDHRTALLHFFEALLDGLGIERSALSSHVRIVEKTPFQEENVGDLLDAFPNAKFIHMVRNPYAVAVSWRKRGDNDLPKPELPFIQRASLELAIENAARYPDVYRIVRYEDLVADADSVMRDAVAYLGLAYRETLLEPMILGEPWSGNSSVDLAFRGVSTEMVDAWRDEIHPVEVYGVNRVLKDLLGAFGYEPLRDPRILLPLRRPNLHVWRRVLYMKRMIDQSLSVGPK